MNEQDGIVRAIAECIRDITVNNSNGLGGVPSGHLYARLMGHMNLDTYNSIIETLKRAGLVTEKNHLLVWVGPTPATREKP